MYGAFIIKKESKFPKFISLFEEKQLKQLLEKDKNTIPSTTINNRYSNNEISNLFVKPLVNE